VPSVSRAAARGQFGRNCKAERDFARPAENIATATWAAFGCKKVTIGYKASAFLTIRMLLEFFLKKKHRPAEWLADCLPRWFRITTRPPRPQ
jgi:hypothetical protein